MERRIAEDCDQRRRQGMGLRVGDPRGQPQEGDRRQPCAETLGDEPGDGVRPPLQPPQGSPPASAARTSPASATAALAGSGLEIAGPGQSGAISQRNSAPKSRAA